MQNSVKQKYFSIAGMVVGAFSVIMSFVVKGKNYSSYELRSSYGGDAYTGIQNAAATTANNVRHLTNLVAYGLLVMEWQPFFRQKGYGCCEQPHSALDIQVTGGVYNYCTS